MKYMITLLFLIFAFCSLYPEDKIYPKDIPITKDMFTTSSTWGNERSEWGYYILFMKDNKYRVYINGEAGEMETNGKYRVENNTLILEPKYDKSINISMYTQKEIWELVCKESNASLYLKRYLQRKNMPDSPMFWDQGSIVGNNELRKVNGIEIVMLNKKGVVTDNAFLREKPDTKSKKIMYRFDSNGEGNTKYEYFLPLDFQFTVFGRTTTKYKVGEWENYWYYCNLNIGGGYSDAGCIVEGDDNYIEPRCWIYGQFIKLVK